MLTDEVVQLSDYHTLQLKSKTFPIMQRKKNLTLVKRLAWPPLLSNKDVISY